MIKLTRLWGVAAAFVLATFLAVPANAQATRTWISGVGDDANPCSRTAPCKTFAGSIVKTAAGGEVDCLDPGGFGAVTITKSITLDCGEGPGGAAGGILNSGTNGININAGATDYIKIRNLNIDGISRSTGPGLSGIKFNTGGALIVEHSTIFNQGGTTLNNGGIDFEPQATSSMNLLDDDIQFGLADGVLVKPTTTGTANVAMTRVSIMNNGASGLSVTPPAGSPGVTVSVGDSNISINANGLRIDGKLAPANVYMTNSHVMGNLARGVYALGTTGYVGMGGDTVTASPNGLVVDPNGKIASFGDNYVFGNATNGAPNGTALVKE